MTIAPFVSNETRPLGVCFADLGFSRWETGTRLSSSDQYDVYLARPRGRNLPFAFLLKALKPCECALKSGAAAIERDRFFGSLNCPRLLPVVDFVRPRLLSPTQARRGCVVVPYFAGKTLARLLSDGEQFSPQTLRILETQLSEALDAARRRGWTLGELTPERILLSEPTTPDAAPIATIVDFSKARRFKEPSLLVDAPEIDRFDPNFELNPSIFCDDDASPETDQKSLRLLLQTLKKASAKPIFRIFSKSNNRRDAA